MEVFSFVYRTDTFAPRGMFVQLKDLDEEGQREIALLKSHGHVLKLNKVRINEHVWVNRMDPALTKVILKWEHAADYRPWNEFREPYFKTAIYCGSDMCFKGHDIVDVTKYCDLELKVVDYVICLDYLDLDAPIEEDI